MVCSQSSRQDITPRPSSDRADAKVGKHARSELNRIARGEKERRLLLTACTMQLSRRAAFHAALLCASTTSVPPLFAADYIAPDTPAPIAADAPIDTGEDVVRDLAHYLPADEKERLIRILRKGEQQTGVRLRVLSRSRASPEWAFEPREVRSRLGIDAPRARGGALTASRRRRFVRRDWRRGSASPSPPTSSCGRPSGEACARPASSS